MSQIISPASTEAKSDWQKSEFSAKVKAEIQSTVCKALMELVPPGSKEELERAVRHLSSSDEQTSEQTNLVWKRWRGHGTQADKDRRRWQIENLVRRYRGKVQGSFEGQGPQPTVVTCGLDPVWKACTAHKGCQCRGMTLTSPISSDVINGTSIHTETAIFENVLAVPKTRKSILSADPARRERRKAWATVIRSSLHLAMSEAHEGMMSTEYRTSLEQAVAHIDDHDKRAQQRAKYMFDSWSVAEQGPRQPRIDRCQQAVYRYKRRVEGYSKEHAVEIQDLQLKREPFSGWENCPQHPRCLCGQVSLSLDLSADIVMPVVLHTEPASFERLVLLPQRGDHAKRKRAEGDDPNPAQIADSPEESDSGTEAGSLPSKSCGTDWSGLRHPSSAS